MFDVYSVQPVLSGHLGAVYIGGRNILALVRSNKADILAPCVFCIQFTCKRLYLALALGRSQDYVNYPRSEGPSIEKKKRNENMVAAGCSATKG